MEIGIYGDSETHSRFLSEDDRTARKAVKYVDRLIDRLGFAASVDRRGPDVKRRGD